MVNADGFHTGQDFIGFELSPSPEPLSDDQAGPSYRSSRKSTPIVNGNGKGKGRAVLDSEDESLLARKHGQRETGKRRAGSVADEGSSRNAKRARPSMNSNDGYDGDDPTTGPRNLKEERIAAERGAPWVGLVDWKSCRDPAEMLNAEITAFHQYMSPTRPEFEIRLYLIELITRAVQTIWPHSEVSPFGSWQTQMYLPQGDIDLVVGNLIVTESNKARLLAQLASAMRQAYITDTVAIIAKARVPIIKFVTSEGGINVDISLNQTNGISAGRIINQYLDVLPGARQLILVVKAFLSQRSMNEVYTGGLGSYAVICLVVSFLQIHPKLRRSEIDPEKNLGTLLIEFFELYGRNFNYDEVGISIRRGGFYFSKRSRGWLKINQAYLLSVEDPQDIDNDISSGSFGMRNVKSTLSGAYQLLQGKLFERAAQMSRANWTVKGKDDVELSLLNSIMGVTKATIKHRAGLKKLHNEGRLQRMLGIPVDADPADYIVNYRSPPRPSNKRLAGLRTNSDDDDSDLDPVKRPRRGSPTINAIVVDDDEVDGDEMFDSSDENDLDEEDMINNGNEEEDYEDYDEERMDKVSDKPEDGKAQVIPNGTDVARIFPTDGSSENEESRYDLGTPRMKVGQRRKVELTNEDLNDLESISDSDDSVIALDGPPLSESSKSAVDKVARKAFWAAKGMKVEPGGVEDDEDMT